LSDSVDQALRNQKQEWSGSAYKIGNQIRLFYTSVLDHHENGSYGFEQTLTTSKIDVSVNYSGLEISDIEDHKSIFDGDNKNHQTFNQFLKLGMSNSGDNHYLKGPHYVEDNGHKYLVFEGNTERKIAIKHIVRIITKLTSMTTVIISTHPRTVCLRQLEL